MKRGSFLTSLLAGTVGLFTFKPIKAEPIDEYDGLCDCCYEEPAVYDGICQSCKDANEDEEDLCECCDELECDCGTPDTTCPACRRLLGSDEPEQTLANNGQFDELLYSNLWPNDRPFPCGKDGPKWNTLDCDYCRRHHNRSIVSSDPERYRPIEIDSLTGKWRWGGDASTWEDLADRIVQEVTGRLPNQQ